MSFLAWQNLASYCIHIVQLINIWIKKNGVHDIWEELLSSWHYILNTKYLGNDNDNTNPYNESKRVLISQGWHRVDIH